VPQKDAHRPIIGVPPDEGRVCRAVPIPQRLPCTGKDTARVDNKDVLKGSQMVRR
jgi:hypothetical protein